MALDQHTFPPPPQYHGTRPTHIPSSSTVPWHSTNTHSLLLHSTMALDQHTFPPPPQYHGTRPTHIPSSSTAPWHSTNTHSLLLHSTMTLDQHTFPPPPQLHGTRPTHIPSSSHSTMALDQHTFPPPPQYHGTRPTHIPSSSTVPWHSTNTHSLLLHSTMALDQHTFPPPPQYHGTRPTHIPSDLGHTSFVYIHHGAHHNPLQRPFAGPFPVLERNEKYLVIDRDGKIEKVTVDRLKTAYPSPVEPLFRPTVASQLPVPTACRPQTWPPQPDTVVPLHYSQFLQHVDHSLSHHSQILQYLFITPSSYSMSTTVSATTARYCSTSSLLPVLTVCRPQSQPSQPDTVVPLRSRSGREIRPRDRLNL